MSRCLIVLFFLGRTLSCLDAAMIFPGDLEDDFPTLVYDKATGDLYVDAPDQLDSPVVWISFSLTSEEELFRSSEAPRPTTVSGPFSAFTDGKITSGSEIVANDLILPSILPRGLSGPRLAGDLTFAPSCFLVLCSSPDLFVVPEPSLPPLFPLLLLLIIRHKYAHPSS